MQGGVKERNSMRIANSSKQPWVKSWYKPFLHCSVETPCFGFVFGTKRFAAQWVFVNIDLTSKHSTKAPKCQLISGSRAWGDARFIDSRELFERMCTCLLDAIYQIGDTRFTRLELSTWSDSPLKWWIDVMYAGKTGHVAPEWSQIGVVLRKCSENLRKHGQIPPWGFILFSHHQKIWRHFTSHDHITHI